MRLLLPLLSAISFPVLALQAQESSPSPTPSETAASPTPQATPADAAKEAAPAPEATPSAETPAATPAPGDVTPGTAKPDVIPMEGQPSAPTSPADAGAPLDTKDIAPNPRTDEAMPDDAFTKPNAVIPDESTPQAPAPPPTAESAQEKARQLSIRYKELRVTAEKDPKIAAMYAKADAAKSDEDRRAALREYYRMLFKKITAADPTLQKKCDDLEAAYMRRLAQVRLEPTIPLNPPPTPEPLSSR